MHPVKIPCDQVPNRKFNVIKNIDLVSDMDVHLITMFKSESKYLCLSNCYQENKCRMVLIKNETLCHLFKANFIFNQTIYSDYSNIYFKL